MRRALTLLATLLTLGTAAAQEAPGWDWGPVSLKIWDNGTAPHSNGITTPEVWIDEGHVGNTSTARLTIYTADPAKATGQAVVICPGGGYRNLSITKEGSHMAQWFARNGITAAVLQYRMPEGRYEVPLEDAEEALRLLRKSTAGSCDAVGIAGCSAGGHLAAMVSTLGRERPDFTILFYPVITGERGLCHEGSFDALLGAERTAGETVRFSLETRIDSATPPALLLHSDNDTVVPTINSTRYYNALKASGIEASMHIYPAGGHGWGMREDFPFRDQWRAAVIEWLGTLGK